MYILNITNTNVDITIQNTKANTEWGISFIATSDNSDYLTQIAGYVTDDELIEITKKVNAIEITEE